ncbi:diguanylate cyclase domain-containing protein [Gracilibacillus marinus]|uniref:Diguanylate cyclase domain-containing protein n=1 Tax=Gracilibacillus marinus TaxID=630535 RepID=A0ABV8VY51_9BACI
MESKTVQDLLLLVNKIIKGKTIFLGETTTDTFTIVKVLNEDSGIMPFQDNQQIDIKGSFCQQIFFGSQEPLIINNTKTHPFTCQLPITELANIHSYMGVPVFYKNGNMYGTLCAIGSEAGKFTEEDIEILTSFANLFTYVIELEKLSYYDPLTNLYNRRYIEQFFQNNHDNGSLLFIDLDDFKSINDTFGHDVGDNVLMEVGKRIMDIVGKDCPIIRLGGDEFAIILPAKNHTIHSYQIADQLNQVLADWKTFEYPITVSASIGIAHYQKTCTNVKQLMKDADYALYKAKRSGKNQYVSFTS